MGSNKNNSLIRNAPILLIIAVWLPQIIYRALAENSPFESLATDTYFALFMATFSYLLGAYAGKLSLVSLNLMRPSRHTPITKEDFRGDIFFLDCS